MNEKLVTPEKTDFMFEFSISISTLLTIALSVLALLMKKRAKNAKDLLQKLKNRS